MQTEQALYADHAALAGLKKGAREQTPESIKEVAKQFEALFVQMMLKSMRDTVPENELFGSKAEKTYQDMYDKQLTKQIANGKGIGLAATIERQLGGVPDNELNNKSIGEYVTRPNQESLATVNSKIKASKNIQPEKNNLSEQINKKINFDKSLTENIKSEKGKNDWNSASKFVQDIWPHAKRAAKKLGVSPDVLVAQSVLETGWGKYTPKNEDGSNSFNLFGIKADQRWQGEHVEINTREVRHGLVQQEKAIFRSYASVAQAFDDYANFIMQNPRYQQALKSSDDGKLYAMELQKAGYATDPAYAEKINRLRYTDLVKNQLQQDLLNKVN